MYYALNVFQGLWRPGAFLFIIIVIIIMIVIIVIIIVIIVIIRRLEQFGKH